jgi:tetratricopeptide (TPR) repeat protein
MKKLSSVIMAGVAGAAVLLVAAGCMNVQAKLKEAYAAASAANWQQGYDITEKVLKKEKGNVDALILNGICRQELGRGDDAATTLEQAATLAPDNFEAQYFYGWVLSENGRFPDALVPLRKAFQLRPTHQDLLILLARCCLEQNLVDGVRYLQALRRSPSMDKRPELYNAMGILWLNKGEHELAKKSFLEAWKRDNENLVVPENLAVLYDQYLHNPTEALRHYRFCYAACAKTGDSIRAAKIQERIAQLEKEAPKTPAAKAPAPVAGTAKAAATAKSGTATKATTATAKTGTKTPAKSTTSTKSTRTTKSGSATKKK